MKLRYLIMLVVTTSWFVSAITLMILFSFFGEDWVNRSYMLTFLIFGGAITVPLVQTLVRNRHDLFRKKK